MRILTISLFTLLFATACEKKETSYYYEQGREFMERQEYQKAIYAFNKVLNRDSTHYQALSQRAVAHSRFQANYSKAFQDIDKAIRLKSEEASLYMIRADIYNRTKEYQKAIKDCNQALSLNPDMVGAYGNRSTAYSLLGKHQEALADINKVIELTEGKDPKAFQNKGFMFFKLKKYKEALENLNKAIKLNPEYDLAFFNRAKTYLQLGDKTKACADLEKSLALRRKYNKNAKKVQALIRENCN